MIEILQQGDSKLILDNTEMFFELEKSHLELAFTNGNIHKELNQHSFTDYYIQTYLKEIYDALTQSKENEADKLPCDSPVGG